MRNKKIVFRGKNFSLFLREEIINGIRTKEEIIEYPSSVGIIPTDRNDKIVLVKQYRFPLQKEIWEIPAGKLLKRESPLLGAKRELEEETGYRAKRWKKLLSFYMAPGYSTEYMTLFLAKDLYFGKINPDEDEFIKKVKSFSLKELKKMIKEGKIKDAKTIISVFLIEK